MGRRHIFSLVQLNTSCFDFAPTSQKQRGLNDEAEIKAVRKAWSTRSTSGIPFVPAMASEEPVLLQRCSERGINLGKSCACAFCLRATAQSRQWSYWCCWESTQSWGHGVEGAFWALLAQKYHFLSGEAGSVCLSVTLPWPILGGWCHRGSGEGWGCSHHGHWCWHGL